MSIFLLPLASHCLLSVLLICWCWCCFVCACYNFDTPFMCTSTLTKVLQGPTYAKYNSVLRGEVKGCTNYWATMHLIGSGLRQLSRTTVVSKCLIVYRRNCNMALPWHFLEPDAQRFAGGVWCVFMSSVID